ncbi:MAG: hypothetical protein CME93_00440 [Hyphomonadaceae bacterium]|nr:hypothetical protein [Hyphomonadaceae bacterium]
MLQDYTEAAKWYQRAAEQAHVLAQYNLGILHASGQGVRQNYAKAAKWYRKAAKRGHASAQCNLGFMHHNGLGVLQDYAKAADLYRSAAEQQDAGAQRNLGIMYGHGWGVPQSMVKAHMWGNIATTNGGDASVRDVAAERMTSKEIAEAQQRAKVCLASNYKDCD